MLGVGVALAAVGAGAAVAMRRRYASATEEAKNATESPDEDQAAQAGEPAGDAADPLGGERAGQHARHVVTHIQATNAEGARGATTAAGAWRLRLRAPRGATDPVPSNRRPTMTSRRAIR